MDQAGKFHLNTWIGCRTSIMVTSGFVTSSSNRYAKAA